MVLVASNVGDVLKEALLVVEEFTVKLDTDIEKGELVCDDGSGNGLVPATPALAVTQKVMMATKEHIYADESIHTMECVVMGQVDVQKIADSGAAKKNDKIMLSATPGECTKFVKGDAPAGGVSQYYTTTIETNMQTAIDKNLGIIGTATEDTVNSDTSQTIILGVY